MTPLLSIVIVNWNGREDLARCLRALAPQRHDDVEVLVVDNGSTDGSVPAARRSCPAARILAQERNLGFARGCNEGIAAATGSWILTLNNDTRARPAFLPRLLETLRALPPDVGMLQPRVELLGRDRLNSTGVLVHRDGSANDRDFEAPRSARLEADAILCPTAGAGCYRREMLDEMRLPSGWFDATYFMYFEDVDLGWRCRLAGWKARYVPDPIVEHVFQASSRKRGRHFVTIHCMRNRVRTLMKNASWRMVLRSLPRTASDLLWLLQHAGGTALAGWLEAAGGALRQRSEVTRRLRTPRRALERQWMRTEPGTTSPTAANPGSSVQW